jgi:hypothetical protein
MDGGQTVFPSGDAATSDVRLYYYHANSLPVLFSLFSFWSPFPFHYHGRNIVSETDDHDIFLLGGGGLVVATTSKMVHRATAASKMGGIAFSAERRGL